MERESISYDVATRIMAGHAETASGIVRSVIPDEHEPSFGRAEILAEIGRRLEAEFGSHLLRPAPGSLDASAIDWFDVADAIAGIVRGKPISCG